MKWIGSFLAIFCFQFFSSNAIACANSISRSSFQFDDTIYEKYAVYGDHEGRSIAAQISDQAWVEVLSDEISRWHGYGAELVRVIIISDRVLGDSYVGKRGWILNGIINRSACVY